MREEEKDSKYEPQQHETSNRVSHLREVYRYLNEQFKSCMKLFREAIEASTKYENLKTFQHT